MKKTIALAALGLLCTGLGAQTIDYKGAVVELGPKAILVDGSLTDEAAARSPYVYNDFREAMSHIVDGTPDQPMRVFLAPWVYWVDDPDDPEVRRAPEGSAPIGMYVKCESLQLLGLSDDARDVVLGCARGQTQGAVGNFTMFDFTGSDLVFRDLTMGNYCNIDLEYPRNPALNRPKRNAAITQAQLAFCHGDRVLAENVRFVARLNLCPLNGAERLLFIGCHFESTDDSLASGVYVGCDLDFWGRQPFGSADRWGTVFFDSDFNIRHSADVQAVSKSVARFSLVDVRYHAGRPVHLGWTLRPEEWLRCYEYNVSVDGMPAIVGAAKPYNTVCMEQSALLGAYRLVEDDGTVLYNTYNLLRGDDGWDPQGIGARVRALSVRDGVDYADIPVCLDLDRRAVSLQTGAGDVRVNASLHRIGGARIEGREVKWKVQPGYEKYIRLAPDGMSCVLTPANDGESTRSFNVTASTDEGLECALSVTVTPSFLPAPEFTSRPELSIASGTGTVSYGLALDGRRDESLVTWYRCDDRSGKGAVPVAVSRGGIPKSSYTLCAGDVGHYLAVGVAPKHLRCEPGTEVLTVSRARIRPRDVLSPAKRLHTDFSDFPTQAQPEVRPGYWTVDAFKPADTYEYKWTADPSAPSWIYGPGINGAKGLGIQQVQQGARLLYTPVAGKYGDMSVVWQVDPAKDGGQGFASARQQYLDLYIKFDTRTLTGYALRVIRTTKFANAVDVLLVRYDDGHVTPVSESVTTDCFLTGCVLSLSVEGSVLRARVEGPNKPADASDDPRIRRSAELEAEIVPGTYGGFGLQHTSTVGTESRILVHSVDAVWK